MVLEEGNNKINKIYVHLYTPIICICTHTQIFKHIQTIKMFIYFSCGSMTTLPFSAPLRQADLEKYAKSMLSNIRYINLKKVLHA